ncbi:hypothetical protein J6590_082989 [Homalodisca vitripennis]|nr:hypothetical protein J6590_082989 [Homalodisca vitripennis]
MRTPDTSLTAAYWKHSAEPHSLSCTFANPHHPSASIALNPPEPPYQPHPITILYIPRLRQKRLITEKKCIALNLSRLNLYIANFFCVTILHLFDSFLASENLFIRVATLESLLY